MKFRVTRSHLQWGTIGLGVILIGYAVLKLGFHINFGSLVDDNLTTVIIFCAIGIFGWNRYLVAEEKKAQEAEEAKKNSEDATDADEDPKKPE
jgi:hypothetical protein